MHYIYCYENKINHHKYVGQTNNLKVRYSAHESQSGNPNSKDYNCLFHKKIREYGLSNFDFYVLEEIDSDDGDYIDYREAFWIEQTNSWCRNGCGYNETTGGAQYRKSLSISDEDIAQIKKLLETTEISFTEMAEQFNTYRECIARINKGTYAYEVGREYPIRITRDWKEISQDAKERIAQEIITTKTPLKDIAKKFSISYHTINLINQGKSNLCGNYTYPLRKTNTITQEQKAGIIQGFKDGKKNNEIVALTGVSRSTVEKYRKKYNIENL